MVEDMRESKTSNQSHFRLGPDVSGPGLMMECRGGGERGQALIEAIVAISLITVSLIGIIALITRSFSFNRDVTVRLQAAYLATEGVELVRRMIDASLAQGRPFNTLVPAGGPYQLDYESDTPSPSAGGQLFFDVGRGYQYGAGAATTFKREVFIDGLGTTALRVRSIVAWPERGAVKQVEMEDIFYAWRRSS